VRVALPMGGVGALLSLNVNVPRYFIQHELGASALGLFAAASYPIVMGDTVVNSIALSASPRLARLYAVGDARVLKHLLLRLIAAGMLIGSVATAVVTLWAAPILTRLYRAAYASAADVFTWIVAAVAVRYSFVFIGVAVTAMRAFLVQLYLRIAMFLGLSALSAALIPRWGLLGAAKALMAITVAEGLAWLAIGYAHIWRDAPQSHRPMLDGVPAAP